MERLVVGNDLFFVSVLEEIGLGNRVCIPAKGESMLPFIRPGIDSIELKPLDGDSLTKGNIVLAKTSENGYVVHRIEKAGSEGIVLRGDGNLSARELCDAKHVFAEVSAVYRRDKKIGKNSFRWMLAKRCWFSNPLIRRIFLGIYRRICGRILRVRSL